MYTSLQPYKKSKIYLLCAAEGIKTLLTVNENQCMTVIVKLSMIDY